MRQANFLLIVSHGNQIATPAFISKPGMTMPNSIGRLSLSESEFV